MFCVCVCVCVVLSPILKEWLGLMYLSSYLLSYRHVQAGLPLDDFGKSSRLRHLRLLYCDHVLLGSLMSRCQMEVGVLWSSLHFATKADKLIAG